MAVARFVGLALLWLAVLGAPAGAQERPSDAEMAAARQLFRSGLAHAREGRWEEARRDFERSYAIAPVPTTLLNLAGAQVETGQLVAGAESYRRFLSEATTGRAARYRDQAREALEAVEARLAHVVLEAEALGAQDVLRVDGEEVSHGVVGVPLPLDPDEHVVTVVRGGDVVAEARFGLGEGEERRVALEVPPRSVPAPAEVASAATDAPPATQEDARDAAGLFSSPWFWTGVGAVVVGTVLIVVLLSASGGQEDPFRGNLGPGLVTYE